MLAEKYEKKIYDSGIKKIIYSIGKDVTEDTRSMMLERCVLDEEKGLLSQCIIRANFLDDDVLEIIYSKVSYYKDEPIKMGEIVK